MQLVASNIGDDNINDYNNNKGDDKIVKYKILFTTYINAQFFFAIFCTIYTRKNHWHSHSLPCYILGKKNTTHNIQYIIIIIIAIIIINYNNARHAYLFFLCIGTHVLRKFVSVYIYIYYMYGKLQEKSKRKLRYLRFFNSISIFRSSPPLISG